MTKNNTQKFLAAVLAGAMALSMAACGAGTGTTPPAASAAAPNATAPDAAKPSGAAVNLTFQIWDVFQQPGMQQLAEAYKVLNPNVTIEIQTTSWDEYWTKLEAAASANNLPNVFWMHTNEFMKYATNNILADISDLHDDTYLNTNFPVGLVQNFSYDGKLYGMPKDWDTIGLAYNKELFDKAGVKYPDDTWDWKTMTDAAQTIFDKTGVYGFLAPSDDQSGYLNTMYQAGGFLVNEDKSKSGFADPGSKLGMEYYIGLQMNHGFSPKQTQFAETGAGDMFCAGQGGMMFLGSWSVAPWLENYPEMKGKWDIAVLPKCPNPVKGDGRASIYNGLAYATGAKDAKVADAKAFIKYLGTEEANVIHGKSGAAIPAFKGTEKYWAENITDISVQPYLDMMAYGVQYPNSTTKSKWKTIVSDKLLEVYNGSSSLDDGLAFLQTEVDGYLAQEKK